jgi:TPR repeat protein
MADLRGLNLLRNDPEAAARLIAEAERGDMDAQYAAGLVYAEGRGVDPDLVQAYFWLTRAMEQGDADAERLRLYVAAQMADSEFAAARRLVKSAKAAAMIAALDGSRARRH